MPGRLSPAVGVDARGDDDRHRNDAAVLPRFHIGRVDPKIGPAGFDRTRKISASGAFSMRARRFIILSVIGNPILPANRPTTAASRSARATPPQGT
jgi:hypothetical protein